jgi:hypothetical protein
LRGDAARERRNVISAVSSPFDMNVLAIRGDDSRFWPAPLRPSSTILALQCVQFGLTSHA